MVRHIVRHPVVPDGPERVSEPTHWEPSKTRRLQLKCDGTR